MREIVFDTETTGLDPSAGDRIVEVGCVELINHLPTGREFRSLINPGRAVSEATVRVTGITDAQLKDAPRFEDICHDLLAFFGDAVLVAHNAEFDRGFLNAEIARMNPCPCPPFPKERFVDTLVLAREHRPGSPASLDAVCKRFNISLEGRELHGALKDARLLAMAYLELRGGRERRFDFLARSNLSYSLDPAPPPRPQRPQALPGRVSEAEAAAHAAFVATLGDNALWKAYGAG
jgi:DNA polymerase III subunit epsilon